MTNILSTGGIRLRVSGARGQLTPAQQAQIDAITTALPGKADTTAVLLRDGSQPATGPLMMGGNPIKDLPYIATDGGDAISKAQFDQESLARYNADNGEAEARADADDALAGRISSSETAILQRQGRPGDAPSRMTATIAGAAASGAPAPGATVVTDDGGAAQLVTGAGIVALRERIALRQGQVIRARFTVQRVTDPTDPAGDTVRLAVQALNKNKVALGSPRIVQDIVLTVANGLHHATATFAFSGADFTWPATALYATVYVQTYGLDGGTAISLIDWEDITGLVEVAADASAAVASETSRATAAETALASEIDTKADNSALTAEVDRATAAETALASEIATKASNTALTAETTDRIDGDAANAAALAEVIGVNSDTDPDEMWTDADGFASDVKWDITGDGFRATNLEGDKLIFGWDGEALELPGVQTYEADITGIIEASVDGADFIFEYRDADGVLFGVSSGDSETVDPDALSVLPIASDRMFFVPGKPMPIYTKNLILDRTDDPHVVASWLSWTVGGSKQAYGLETSDRLLYVDPAKLCVNNRLTTRVYGPVTNTINYRVIGARIANVPAASAPLVIHLVGTSIPNRGVAAGLQTHLTAFGYAPTFIGSLRGAASGANYTDDTGPLGDGHEGWGFTHLTYRQTVAGGTAIIPLPVGQESAYLAMTKAEQEGYNVFLRLPNSGNPNDAAETFNGYVFDYDFGRTRWPVPWAVPDVIPMGDMFTNDLKTNWPSLPGAQLDNAIAQGEAAMRQVITSIRRSLSTVKIPLWMPVLANKSKYAYGGSDARWPANARVCAILDAFVREKNAAGDANIALSPVWLHMSAECDMLGAALDPATGIYTSSHEGTVHPDIMAREQMIFALFATIAAFHNGVSAA